MPEQGAKTRKIRIGVIGSGDFAQVCHVPGLQSHSQAEIVAICGHRYDHTRAMANRFNIPNVHTDYRELCARRDIDAVTIVTASADHAHQACTALAAGKHVFCEKPLAMNVADARRMVDIAGASKRIHQVAFTYRYLFGVQDLRRRVRHGDIGTPHYLRVQYDTWEGFLNNYRANYRGGILYEVGSHLFDIARFILGPIQATTGFSQFIPPQDSYGGIPEDVNNGNLAAALFIYENGVYGQWFASLVTPPLAERSYVEVIGREGALRASLSRGSVDVLRVSTPTKSAWEELPLPEQAHSNSPHCLGIMMRSFVDACLRGELNSDIDASFYEGLAAQEGLAAVTESMARNNWVRLKETL